MSSEVIGEKPPHLDIFYQFICYLLSELRAGGGWVGGGAFEAKGVNEIVVSDIHVTFFFLV